MLWWTQAMCEQNRALLKIPNSSKDAIQVKQKRERLYVKNTKMFRGLQYLLIVCFKRDGKRSNSSSMQTKNSSSGVVLCY
mmetsp:Transcript_14631/g.23819  ORF Transcript_14631/g.23819 Transcript_14631/m.23819 type:complete len:80 (-) Transcript_14631:375-614(-)